MDRLRAVAVGAGYFSHFHFEAWSRMPDVDLVGICDIDRARLAAAGNRWNVPRCYTDVVEMLDREKPDFIDIITRPDTHRELVQRSAERAIPIICQKPVANTYGESAEIIRIAQQAGVRLMIHENFRFQPWYREIKRQLQDGAIGDLFTLNVRTRTGDGWQPDAYLARQPYFRQMPRFLVLETGIHFIDTFRFLAGEVRAVFASLRRLNPQIQGEDCGVVLFEFASGASGMWDANRYNEPNYEDRRYTFGEALIEGSRGSLRLYADGRLTFQPLGKGELEIDYPHSHANFAGDCVYATQRHFIDCLKSAEPFETNGENYLRSLRVQEAIYESAERGCRQPIDDYDGNAQE